MGLWLGLGLILCAGGVYVSRQPGALNGPMHVRLNIHFDPAEVNPRNPKFKARAFIKTATGNQEIPILPTVREGGLSVDVTVPTPKRCSESSAWSTRCIQRFPIPCARSARAPIASC